LRSENEKNLLSTNKAQRKFSVAPIILVVNCVIKSEVKPIILGETVGSDIYPRNWKDREKRRHDSMCSKEKKRVNRE